MLFAHYLVVSDLSATVQMHDTPLETMPSAIRWTRSLRVQMICCIASVSLLIEIVSQGVVDFVTVHKESKRHGLDHLG